MLGDYRFAVTSQWIVVGNFELSVTLLAPCKGLANFVERRKTQAYCSFLGGRAAP